MHQSRLRVSRMETRTPPGTVRRSRGRTCRTDSTEHTRLLLEQLPEVQYIARRIHGRMPQHIPFEDLVGAGVLGLLEAVRKYDPSKNVQLRTYAKFRIQGAILDSLRSLDWSSRTLRRRARQLELAEVRLQARHGRPPTEAELAAELQVGLNELRRLLSNVQGLDLVSLQARILDEDRGPKVDAHLRSAPEHDPLALCLRAETRNLLTQAIGRLPMRQRQVVWLYYVEELTMKAIGAVLGVGESRVSQLHSAALMRLRTRLQQLFQSPPASNLREMPPVALPSFSDTRDADVARNPGPF